MLKHVIHRWLRVPYVLHVHTDRRVKNPQATVLFLHGIGNSSAAWDDVVGKLPANLHIISIDLLGFGDSPRPSWVVYNAKTQARSVFATLVKLGITHPIILAGHSLGALVAVEITKQYPLLVKSLVLFSPPFYRINHQASALKPNTDKMRREIYRLIKNRPDQLIRITALGLRLGLFSKTFSLTKDNAPIYFNTFEASILNQTSLEDAVKLRVPTQIVYGRLDPTVIAHNLRYLKRQNSHITLTPVLASHEIIGPYIDVAAHVIANAIENKRIQ